MTTIKTKVKFTLPLRRLIQRITTVKRSIVLASQLRVKVSVLRPLKTKISLQ